MKDTGEIVHLSADAHEELLRKRLEETEQRIRHTMTPLSDDEARFFKSKGTAFREIWGRRLAKGLTPSEKEFLEGMVTEFVKAGGGR